MKPLADSEDPAALERTRQCGECGATTRVGQGLCANCLLRQGLEAEGEASAEAFERVLGEAKVFDAHWRLGNYQILEEIGRGGMGVIYRARQRHSGRIVALKRVLAYNSDSHEALVRFRREAEAAAKLDHPNILPIYEVGESEDGLPFFSMKYATGGSLRTAAAGLQDRPNECVRLIAKVARAIDYAHGEGILHRDLQPGNILLDSRGEPLVSDFGLAKWMSAESDLTKSLTSFGTPGYIAPEQAESAAGELTPAADVYGLGAILFYLLANRPPFVGTNVLSVIRQAAANPAPKLRSLASLLDRDLETICARCLERDPPARYQSAGDLAEDLERWLKGQPILARPVPVAARAWRWSRRNPILAGAAAICLSLGVAVLWLLSKEVTAPPMALPPEKSIAVLPFENLSNDKDNAYFAAGVQDEILSDLAKIADLKVISRASTRSYEAGKPRNLRQIGQQLGVAHILEGSVQRTGNHLRINAQLIDTRTDSQLWANTFDRKLTDIFSVETEVAKTIANQLRAKISNQETQAINAKSTNNPLAYDAYLRGLAYSSRPFYSSADNLDAIKYFGEAVKLDPKFALAWSWLARVSALRYHNTKDTALCESAKQAAHVAVELRPDLGEAYLAQGYWQYYCEHDYHSAIQLFEAANELLPSDAQPRHALALVCRRLGEWQRSLDYFRQAVELDPRDPLLLTDHAGTLEMLRQYPAALKRLDQILDMLPGNQDILAQKVFIYQEQGNLASAAELLSSLHPRSDLYHFRIQTLQWTYERHYSEAITAIKTALAGPNPEIPQYLKIQFEAKLAWLQQFAGDDSGARATWERIQTESEAKGEQVDDIDLASAMALGDKAKAFEIVERDVNRIYASKDTLALEDISYDWAWVAVQAGNKDFALQKLAVSAERPAGISYGDLKLSPFFDPLRGDPRFEKIVASLAPKDR